MIDNNYIIKNFKKSQILIDKILKNKSLHNNILKTINFVITALKNNNKLLLIGNGGSAAEAQHIAAEYVSRFKFDRDGLAAIALTTDTSILTAIGNDYGFECLFSRQIEAIGKAGDILFAYTTSGTSKNILKALKISKRMNIKTICMTGDKPESLVLNRFVDLMIRIPSIDTPHIQVGHLVISHLICQSVEKAFFKNRI